MAFETLLTSAFGEDAPPPSQWSDGSAACSVEERFCSWGRSVDRIDQRANDTPGPAEFAWSRDDGYDDGFGL
jgi:hypothetical protein